MTDASPHTDPLTDPRWELLPAAPAELRVPHGDPTDATERRTGLGRVVAVLGAIAAAFMVLASINPLLAVFAALAASVGLVVWYRRSGGGAKYRAELTEWAAERGLEDLGGEIWSWDGSRPIDEAAVIAACAGAIDAGVPILPRRAAQLRGRFWDAAGAGATLTSVEVRAPGDTTAYVTVVSVRLGAPQAAPLPAGVPGLDGLSLSDGQLEGWVNGNLLRGIAMERWGRERDRPIGLYAGSGDAALSLLALVRDVHRTVVGDRAVATSG